MHNSFIFQQYICYTTPLNTFRAARCSTSGGPIVSPQPLASSASVSSRTVWRWRADATLSTFFFFFDPTFFLLEQKTNEGSFVWFPSEFSWAMSVYTPFKNLNAKAHMRYYPCILDVCYEYTLSPVFSSLPVGNSILIHQLYWLTYN